MALPVTGVSRLVRDVVYVRAQFGFIGGANG